MQARDDRTDEMALAGEVVELDRQVDGPDTRFSARRDLADVGSLAPEWDQYPAQRRRLLLFLILAGLYVAYHVVFRWVEYPLFRATDWYYFGRERPSWFEVGYRF